MKRLLILMELLCLIIFFVGCTEPHTHNYVEGICECGEKDPNYKPPHTHNYVEGICECGEEDPNYKPPHTHNYVEGICECGEKDPNYEPPHEHIFDVFGVCLCGKSDMHTHEFIEGKCWCRVEEGIEMPDIRKMLGDIPNGKIFNLQSLLKNDIEKIHLVISMFSVLYQYIDADYINYFINSVDVEYMELDYIDNSFNLDLRTTLFETSYRKFLFTIIFEDESWCRIDIYSNGYVQLATTMSNGEKIVLISLDQVDFDDISKKSFFTWVNGYYSENYGEYTE